MNKVFRILLLLTGILISSYSFSQWSYLKRSDTAEIVPYQPGVSIGVATHYWCYERFMDKIYVAYGVHDTSKTHSGYVYRNDTIFVFADSTGQYEFLAKDSLYFEFGCNSGETGWYFSEDTVRVDTCLGADSIYYAFKDTFSDDGWYGGNDTVINDTSQFSINYAGGDFHYLDFSEFDFYVGVVNIINKSNHNVTLTDYLTLQDTVYFPWSNTGERVALIVNPNKSMDTASLVDKAWLLWCDTLFVDSIYLKDPPYANQNYHLTYDPVTELVYYYDNTGTGGAVPDTFFVEYTCNPSMTGYWIFSGDTIYVDTCGTSSVFLWYLTGDTVRNMNGYKVLMDDSVYVKRAAIPWLEAGEPFDGGFLTIRKLPGAGNPMGQIVRAKEQDVIDTLLAWGVGYWELDESGTQDTLKNKAALDPGVLLLLSEVMTDRWLHTNTNTVLGMGAGNQFVHSGGVTGWNNALFGNNAGNLITSGYNNTHIGSLSGDNNVTGYANTSVGYNSFSTTPSASDATYNTVVGFDAGTWSGSANITGNTVLGASAGGSMAGTSFTTNINNTILGYLAGSAAANNVTSAIQNNILIGSQAGYRMASSASKVSVYNIAIGQQAMGADSPSEYTDGDYNIAIGSSTLANADGADFNIVMGDSAAFALTTADNDIYIGRNAGRHNTIGFPNLYIGAYSGEDGTGSGAYNNVFVGRNTGQYNQGNNNVAVGYLNLQYIDGNFNTAVGSRAAGGAGSYYAGASNNTALGSTSLFNLRTGDNNTAAGSGSLGQNTTGYNNTAFGYGALTENVANYYSTAVGYYAMRYADNRSTGRATYNTAIGYRALYGSASASANTGQYNTIIGADGFTTNTSGEYNTAIGALVGNFNTTGSSNVYIGYNVGTDASLATQSNKLMIDNSNTTSPLIYGEFNNDVVIFNGSVNFASDAQPDDDYEIDLPSVSALTVGLTVTFIANTANTGGATLEITGVGDIDAILKMHDQALATGDIEAGQVVVCVWDGTNWQMTSQLAQ